MHLLHLSPSASLSCTILFHLRLTGEAAWILPPPGTVVGLCFIPLELAYTLSAEAAAFLVHVLFDT